MPHCRKLLRDKPKTTLPSLKEAFMVSRLEDAMEVVRDGRGSPQLICACAWRALELLVRDLPDMHAEEWIFKHVLVDALTAAIEFIETEHPGACEYLVSGCLECEPPPKPVERMTEAERDELPLL